MASDFLRKKAEASRKRQAEYKRTGKIPVRFVQSYASLDNNTKKEKESKSSQNSADPYGLVHNIGRGSVHSTNQTKTEKKEPKILQGGADPYGLIHSVGRGAGHGMNLTFAEQQAEETRQKDIGRRTELGASSVGNSLKGAIPAMYEAGAQRIDNYSDNMSRKSEFDALNKERAMLVERYTLAHYGHSDENEQELWAQIKEVDARIENWRCKTPVDQSLYGQRTMAKAREQHAQAVEGLSGADRFLADTAISIGSNIPALAVSVVNPAAGLTMMGTLAAAQKTSELSARGVEAGEALKRGITSGAIEAVTEKVPLDNLMSIIKLGGGKSFVKTLMKQMGIEATEESASYMLNYVADKAYKDPEAVWSWSELMQSAGAGALSGGVFGVAGIGINSITTNLKNKGVSTQDAEKQANIIYALTEGKPISGNQAVTIARSPVAVNLLSEIIGRDINTNAPLSEVKKEIMALPAKQVNASHPKPLRNQTKTPNTSPVIELSGQQSLESGLELNSRQKLEEMPGKLNNEVNQIEAGKTNNIESQNKAVDSSSTKATKPLSESLEKQLEGAILKENTPNDETTASVPTFIKSLPRSASNLFKKWASNEYVNIDLGKVDSETVSKYVEFFNTWYQAGKIGKRTIDVEPKNYDFPPFLEEVFYNEGKRVASKEKVKAEQKNKSTLKSKEKAEQTTPKPLKKAQKPKKQNGGAANEISTDNTTTNTSTVPSETSRGTLETVATKDVPRTSEQGDATRNSTKPRKQSGRPTNGLDAERNGRGRSLGSRQGTDIPSSGELEEKAVSQPLNKVISDAVDKKIENISVGNNFVIGESLNLPKGEKTRFKANIQAIKLVKTLMAEERNATPDEQIILSKYVGWGGLPNAFDSRKEAWAKEYKQLKELLTKEEYDAARASTLNAHYTSVDVIRAMYDGLSQLGYKGGRVLEPSGGIGNFIGVMPTEMSDKTSWSLVELDTITGNIAKYLYPNADIRVKGFEKTIFPDDVVDVAIGNVPFGNFAVTDKAYPKTVTSSIHNYFFAKALDKVRPGGVIMFITSRYTMDSVSSEVRKYIADRADLLGAIRLPDTAFKSNADTEVVTDIIVLKKRAPGTPYSGESFIEASDNKVDGRYAGTINEYFKSNPKMVLGNAVLESGMYHDNPLTYKAKPGKIDTQIKKAFVRIKGTMDYAEKPTREVINQKTAEQSAEAKDGSNVIKDGKIYIQKDGKLEDAKLSVKNTDKVKRIVAIRDIARKLLYSQLSDKSEVEINTQRQQLNKEYDEFVDKYGHLNAQGNRRLYNKDPDMAFISALENYDKETKTGSKSDIFEKNTVARNVSVTHVDSAQEGLIVSVNETGAVDIVRISELTGLPEKEVANQLMEAGLIFKTRTGDYETSEQYLSGNVRVKLRDAEALALLDNDFKRNVAALKKVMPSDIPNQAIHVTPGATWIPKEVYEQFASKLTGSSYIQHDNPITVKYNVPLAQFSVEGSAYVKRSVGNTQEWGTRAKTFLKIYEAILNNKSLTVKYKAEDGKVHVDKKATIAVNEKAEAIKTEFTRWIWSDEARTQTLTKLYNEMFNNTVNPKYDGTYLTIDGANASKPLRQHQKDVIQRIIMSGGNTLIAHEVGAGKTAEMAGAAMKLRQLGIVKKPMFLVPKSLVAQWGREFLDFFPSAKILVAGEHDTERKNRRAFSNRVATGDYDAVILSYENFKALPMSSDTQQEFLSEQIAELTEAIEHAVANGSRKDPSVKQMEKTKKNFEVKLENLGDMKKDTDNIDFEALGVDSLFVDEAHNYKNLFYTTNMNNVSGLGNKKGSQRAFDLYMKVRWMQKFNKGRGIVFATATPVMNSMSEMYIIQKYLQYDMLKQRGLTSFDAWAKQFGEVRTVLEIKPSGKGYRQKESFSQFKNIPELMQMFHKFADVLIDVPGLKIPKVKRETIVSKPSAFVENYINQLEERAEKVAGGQVDPSEDNMLKITSDGRKASYTQRMIEPSMPYEDGSKISKCIDKVFDVWKETKKDKSTQLIFCDLATPKGENKSSATESPEEVTQKEEIENVSIYHDIKKQLVLKGIAEKEIAFIHDANTQARKAKLFEDMNAGRVRVLIGSTGKMGVGMNAQKKIIALHHLDSPWRPGDVKQQEGRMLRQGNENKETTVYTYVTEGTFDARMWDGLERKAKFINAIMNGTSEAREIEDVGEQTLSFAEIKALASGNPLIQEQVEVSNELQKLSAVKSEHISSVSRAQKKLKETKADVAETAERISKIEEDIKVRKDVSGDKFTMIVGKGPYKDREMAGKAILKEAKRIAKKSSSERITETVGKFAGYDIQINNNGDIYLVGKLTYPANLNIGSATGTVQSLENIVRNMDKRLSDIKKLQQSNEANVAKLEELAITPFPKQDRLTELLARYNEIIAKLNPKENAGSITINEDEVGDALNTEANENAQQLMSDESEDKWRTERVTKSTKVPMRLSDIVEKIRYDFGITVTTGHIRKKNTLGEYDKKTHGVRTKIANDLPTIAHELGHHLDNKYNLTSGISDNLRAELEDGLSQKMKKRYPEKKWKTEGFAEFIRKYLQNSEFTSLEYPEFTDFFRSKLTDNDLNLIDSNADEVNAHYALDTDTATSSIRTSDERKMDFRSYAEKIKDFGDSVYQAWVDSNHGIKQFDRATGSDTYKLASNSAYSDSVADSLLTGDLTNKDGAYIGDGLFATLSDIDMKNKKEYKAFGEYLVVKHGPERLVDGLRVFANRRKNTEAWMKNRQTELEEQYPHFKETSEKLYKFQKSFLRAWGVDTGLVSAESAKEWGERWDFYVPFNRAINKKGHNGAKKGFANQDSTIKKAVGSGEDFIHPVENIVDNVIKMVNAGTRNNVMVEITKGASKAEGTAIFLEKVPMPLQKKAFDTTKLKGSFKKATTDASLNKDAENKVFDIIDGLDDVLIQFGRGHAHGDVVTVLRDGKSEYWKINDPALLSSISNMSPRRLPAWMELIGRVSRFITSNITGMNVVWSLFSNSPRDFMTLLTYSEDRNPLHLLGGIGSAYLNKMKGSKADPLFKEYISMGGSRTSVYSADIDLTRKIRRKVAGSKLKWLNPLEWVEFVADMIELGPRFSYYKILRNRGCSAQEAFYGSTDVTVNFRRSGVESKTLNYFVPFFNASVQGLDKYARWQTANDVPNSKRKHVAKSRAIGLFSASLALAALSWGINSSDDEKKKDYAQLSNFSKNNYWNTPLGDGKYFAIPKPRELGVLSSFMETLMEKYANKNENAFDGFHEYLAEMNLPPVISDIAQGDFFGALGSTGIFGVVAQLGANKDFLGRPIVSGSLQYLESKDQFTRRTSKIAYWIGQAFNQSPQRLDFFFQQTLGGFWKSQKALFPIGNENVDVTLGVQNTYIKDNLYSNDLVNWLYDGSDTATRAKNSNPGDMEKAIKAKWYANMTSFYSNFIKLSKEESETVNNRYVRQNVLNMISEFNKNMDNDYKTTIQKRVEQICNQAGETKYLPGVMPSTLKNDDGKTYNLTANEYYDYQTEYLGLYWDYVGNSLAHDRKQDPKVIITKAKAKASVIAKSNALKRQGVKTDDYEEQRKMEAIGIEPWEDILFDVTTSKAKSNSNSSRQEQIIKALNGMNYLTDKERDYLFGTVYTSDKNNPFD